MPEQKGFWKKILSTLDTTTTGGFSARKVSAAIVMLCVFVAHIAWIKRAFMTDNFTLMESILAIDYAFVAACLGMTTYERIKTNNANNTTTEQTSVGKSASDGEDK